MTTLEQSKPADEARDSVLRSGAVSSCNDLLPGQFVNIINGDCRTVLKELAPESIQCVVTSPPYWGLRNYGHAEQIGQEETPQAYVETLRQLFAEVWRVLRDDGTLWLNLGDSYSGSGKGGNPGHSPHIKQRTNSGSLSVRGVKRNGLKPKDLIGVPWLVAFALQSDGWYLRSDIIWHKPNPMPESVTDRPTRSHEYIFLLTKSERYYYNHEAIKEPCIYDLAGTGTEARKARQKECAKSLPTAERHGIRPPKVDKQRGHSRRHDGFNDRWDQMEKAEQCTGMRNKRDVWNVAPANYPEAHFATYPPDLIKPCILAGTRPAGKRCDCAETIRTPTGSGAIDDPTPQTGRPITKREQRSDAAQMAVSAHRGEIEAMCGPAFAHYIRTDESGARPLPEDVRSDLLARGWITPPSPCDCPVFPADVVLDPFGGSGTTGMVALELGRRAVLVELNPEYTKLCDERCTTTRGLPLAG